MPVSPHARGGEVGTEAELVFRRVFPIPKDAWRQSMAASAPRGSRIGGAEEVIIPTVVALSPTHTFCRAPTPDPVLVVRNGSLSLHAWHEKQHTGMASVVFVAVIVMMKRVCGVKSQCTPVEGHDRVHGSRISLKKKRGGETRQR